jgi:hypothetical protein
MLGQEFTQPGKTNAILDKGKDRTLFAQEFAATDQGDTCLFCRFPAGRESIEVIPVGYGYGFASLALQGIEQFLDRSRSPEQRVGCTDTKPARHGIPLLHG